MREVVSDSPPAPGFKDHFSVGSADYARFRPGYPRELYAWLAGGCAGRRAAWDCATGSGQVAVGLADYFDRVEATDASADQVAAALPAARVNYTVAAAEAPPFEDRSFDLVTVGQALHWFDTERFFAAARRVAVPGALLAAWCYEKCTVSAAVDAAVETLYSDIVGPYWPPERRLIERGYRDFDLPGEDLEAPAFDMALAWRANDMLGYLGTWSACRRYSAEHGSDPVDRIADDLQRAWGDDVRTVRWPLRLRVCRLTDR